MKTFYLFVCTCLTATISYSQTKDTLAIKTESEKEIEVEPENFQIITAFPATSIILQNIQNTEVFGKPYDSHTPNR